MKGLSICETVSAIALTAVSAGAQTKTITGETKVVTATVEGIERSTREVTVKKPDGKYEVFTVPADVKKFDTLKIGDKVTARYYENMVLRLKAPGEKSVDTPNCEITQASGGNTSATAAVQRTNTATIKAIDQKTPSITFAGPNGWEYSTRVEDKAALAKVKVGDKVDITWTEALIVSL